MNNRTIKKIGNQCSRDNIGNTMNFNFGRCSIMKKLPGAERTVEPSKTPIPNRGIPTKNDIKIFFLFKPIYHCNFASFPKVSIWK